jgi:negative regulator of flagellin synthesis FlgM
VDSQRRDSAHSLKFRFSPPIPLLEGPRRDPESSKVGGIDGSSQSSAIGAGRAVQRPQDADTGSAQNSSGSAGNESVQITGAARQLAGLEQAIRDLPAVNDARVAQISNSIEQGTYSVNSRQIADQLIQMEKALKDLPGKSGADTESDTD